MNFSRSESMKYLILLPTILIVSLVFILRLYYNFDFSTPRQMFTSGYEEESLYSIWKYIHGLPVYADYHKIPYAASFFNFGYYFFYGEITKVVLLLFNLGDEWIPQVARLITTCGCIIAFAISGMIIRDHISRNSRLTIVDITLLLILFFGFLTGFWAITVRPDIWALTFELAALYYILNYIRQNRIVHFCISLFFILLAWSFKQNFILMGGGLFIYFLMRSKWLAVMLMLLPGCMAILFYFLGTDTYRYLLVSSQAKAGIFPSTGIYNLRMALMKSLPAIIPAMLVIAFLFQQRLQKRKSMRILSDTSFQVLLTVFLFSFPVSFFMSMKLGAAENYFYTPVAAATLLLAAFFHHISIERLKLLKAAFYACCCFYAGFGCLILSGKAGKLSLSKDAGYYSFITRTLSKLPKPAYVESDNYANLPWINKSDKNFVLSATYYYKELYGEEFEEGGIEGLKQKGYFKTIIDPGHWDTAYKQKYVLNDSLSEGEEKLYIWRRKDH